VANPDNDTTAAQDLQHAVADISTAMHTAVVKRCTVENIAKICNDVVAAANADFLPVYESVWSRLEGNDAAGTEAYRQAMAPVKFPVAEAVQSAKDPVELLRHGSGVMGAYARVIRDVVNPVKGATPIIPTVSACVRLLLALFCLITFLSTSFCVRTNQLNTTLCY
jgi:hypothetical protein